MGESMILWRIFASAIRQGTIFCQSRKMRFSVWADSTRARLDAKENKQNQSRSNSLPIRITEPRMKDHLANDECQQYLRLTHLQQWLKVLIMRYLISNSKIRYNPPIKFKRPQFYKAENILTWYWKANK